MATSVTLPAAQTARAAPTPLDASGFGLVVPVLPTSPTDAMWGTPPPNGTLVLEAGPSDTGFVLWARIGGTWRGGVIA